METSQHSETTSGATYPRARRGSTRAKVDAFARIENGPATAGFSVSDISLGGVRVVGHPDNVDVRVGSSVRVRIAGSEKDCALDIDAWAEVRRVGNDEMGLSWDGWNPQLTEQIAYFLASRGEKSVAYVLSDSSDASIDPSEVV